MRQLNYDTIIGQRLKRQRLFNPLEYIGNDGEYIGLFRQLQPVSPVYNTRPGDPPKLVHRTEFDDEVVSAKLREQNKIVKGRFCSGRIGYVVDVDLELYATAFQKPLRRALPIHDDIMELLRNSGGMSKDQLKQELNYYPAREISKALETLQAAFLVYENQPDGDWDTGWFDFATEWFEVETDRVKHIESVAEVTHRFIKSMVFATLVNIKSWSGFPTKVIEEVVKTLVTDETIVATEITGLGKGFMSKEDSLGFDAEAIPDSIFMLDKSDILVRAHLSELQKQFKGYEVLEFLLIDGQFKGAVLGHWGFGPYDIDDIVLELSSNEILSRKDEIIHAVRRRYSAEHHAIVNYNGVPQ